MKASAQRRWATTILATCMLVSACMVRSEASEELVFLTWADYLDPEVAAAFEAEFEVQLRTVYYGSDSDRDRILSRAERGDFDLAVIDGTSLEVYRKLGWVSELAEKQLPNLANLDSYWRNAYPSEKNYAVPYFWGTTGIAYRADLVAHEPLSWRDLFHPDKSLCGRITLHDDSVDVIAVALKSLGYSPHSSAAKEVEAARQLLTKQRPCVAAYESADPNMHAKLVTGEVAAAMFYNGDAITLRQYNQEIRYVLPREGAAIWVDYLSVLKGSKRKKLAWAFIDFLNRPERAAQNALFNSYASPNTAASDYLPDAFLRDEAVYPSQEAFENAYFDRNLAPRARKTRTRIFVEIKNLKP